MSGREIRLIILSSVVLATQVTASELTASLAEKVRICDLVAIITISNVEKGDFNALQNEEPEDEDFNVKLTASVTERIKGSSPDEIEIYACSVSRTAGFSDHGIRPGRSYIGYLQATSNGTYHLGWGSNQFLEVISDDGGSVNDIGQTNDQVPLEPKLRTLRALAAGGRLLALIAHPLALLIALSLSLLVGVAFIRKKRFGTRKQPE